MNFKFIHAADLHLDSPFYGFSEDSLKVQKVLRDSTFKAFKNIVKLSIEEKVDFLVIAGDIYDEANNNLRGQYKFYEGVKKLAEKNIKVFVVHGNHDHLGGYRANIKWPDNIFFFDKKIEKIPFYKDGELVAMIHGISYEKRDVEENLSQYFSKSDLCYNIALLHTDLGGDNYAPCKKEELINKGFDYWALGHVHNRKVIHEKNPVILYPGNTQARSIKETGEKGVFLVEVKNNETFYTFKPVHHILWEEIKVSIEEIDTGEKLLDTLNEKIEKLRPSTGGAVVRIYLEGRGNLYYELTKKGLYKELLDFLRENEDVDEEGFVFVEDIVNNTSPPIDKSKYYNEASIIGDFLQISEMAQKSEEIFQIIKEKVNTIFEDTNQVAKFIEPPSDEELKKWLLEAEELGFKFLVEDE